MIWILFILLIGALLALDLGVFHKKNTTVSMRESLIWTLVWIGIAILFGAAVYYIYAYNLFGINIHGTSPGDATTKYFTAYLIEKVLSLDNIFVIAMIFGYFKIENKYQHKILFWGIIGAVVFRGIMIFAGIAFIERFSWAVYIFGGILIFSGIKMLFSKEKEVDYSKNKILALLSKIHPIKWEERSEKFMIKENGKSFFTASFAALIIVEFTDILFAVDSVPAVLAVSSDSFIIFTSNIFAILGLRNLYFFLASIMDKFYYIKYSLVTIIIYVGVKMILMHHVEIPNQLSIIIILLALAAGLIVSLLKNKKTLE